MKRILSLALVLAMVLSMVPATVFAAEATPALPTAKVSEIKKDDLTFAMNFRVNSVTEEQLAYYGNWYADFELTINKKVSFDAEGTADGWLSGQYDEWSYDWVNVPFGKNAPVTIEAGETVKIMAFAAELMDEPGLKYTVKEVYETVKDFNCGVYFDDEFLTANPDLEVKLELKMYNPANEAESYVIGETYTYENPIVAKNTTTGKVYTTVNEATMDAQEGETVVLLKDSTEMIVSVFAGATLDLNGHTLAATYVTSFGNIIDSSANNDGLLAVSASKLMLREDNAQLPIRTENGYLFAEVLKISTAMKDANTFAFQPRVEPGMLDLLKQGSDITDVTIQVLVSWKQNNGYRTQSFVYNNDFVAEYLNSYNAATDKYSKMFTLTLSGAENFEELTFTALVVSDTGVSRSDKDPIPEKPAGNVTTDANNQVVNDVTIGSGNASAQVSSGTQLESGVNNITLNATEMEKTTSNITVGDGEKLVSMNVHVDGVAANNTKPIIVTLTNLAPEALNQGNLELYHVENGETVLMTRVYSIDEVDAHNEYYYDIATGTVTMALATFSEIAALSEEPKWEGDYDYSWYTKDPTADEFFIYNADQLAGLSAIVGGMNGQTQDSFAGKTITLLSNINLNDAEAANKDWIFYPIGYWNSEGTYERTNTAISSGFYTFEGTFDGNGNTVMNFYQNTWEMKGDHDWYTPEEQYYRDGMGLFGKVYGGTVKNLTVKNFSSDGEITTTGCIAAYADFGATFENIAIYNCNPRVYNIGNGGIVGCVGWYTKAETDKVVTFKNITVDNSNKISALWGSYDVACGGILGQYYPTSGQTSAGTPKNAGVHFENCHVSAIMDVYNDVCANYQYYAYRYTGMLIGSVRENVTIDGRVYPKMDGITASGCTVHYGDWNDYYYCELVANSLASYTHDHQMSRLTQVKAVDVENMKYLPLDAENEAENWVAIPNGRVNYVVVKEYDEEKGAWVHGDGHDYAECYHFVDGAVWNHEDAGTETVGGVEGVLKEDKQLVYREFNNLVTGYGWGVTSKGVKDVDGVEILDIEESVSKFEPVVGNGTSFKDGQEVSVGKLFAEVEGLSSLLEIESGKVQVFVSPANEDSTARGTYAQNKADWKLGKLTFSGYGLATITITDYYYCTATTLVVNVLDKDAEIEIQNNMISNGSFGEVRDILTYNIVAADVPAKIGWVRPNNFAALEMTNRYGEDEQDYAAKVVHQATNTKASALYQTIPLTNAAEGTKIKLTANLRGTAGGTKDAYMRLAFYSGANGQTSMGTGNKSSGYFQTSEDWVSYSVEATVPKDATFVRVNVAYVAANTNVEMYIDDAVFTIGDSTENKLVNPSFDDLSGLSATAPIDSQKLFFMNETGWNQKDSQIIKDESGMNAYLYLDGREENVHAWGGEYNVDVIPGADYKITFRYKSTAPVKWYLNEYSDDANKTRTHQNILTLGAAENWTTVEILYNELREDTEGVRIYPYFPKAADNDGEAWFDDFVLTKVCGHTWSEANVVTEATCTTAGTSVRTCIDCGATETATTKIPHEWVNGVCEACSAVCTHELSGGVCLNCKAEVPALRIDNLISNGSFDSGEDGWNLSTATDKLASVTDEGYLKLYDNLNNSYPTAWFGGIPIEIGKTYTFEFDYMLPEGAETGFTLNVALRGNYAWGDGATLATQSYKYNAETAGIWQKDKTITFTVTEEMQDTLEDRENHSVETFYVMLYSPSATKGTIYIDNISLVENCDGHVWVNPVITEADCENASCRVVECAHCAATGVTELAPATGHTYEDAICKDCGAAEPTDDADGENPEGAEPTE